MKTFFDKYERPFSH